MSQENVHLVMYIVIAQPGDNWQVAAHDEQAILDDFEYSDSNGSVLERTGNLDTASSLS